MSALSIEFFIAVRYLRVSKKGFFSLLTTLIAIGGTTLGVAALVITLAVMSGFQSSIRNNILGKQPHIVVARTDNKSFKDYLSIEDTIKTNKSVVSVFPFIEKQGIVRGKESNISTGIIIKAVDYENESNTLNFSKQIKVSSMNFDGKKIGNKSIILGNEIAKCIHASVGDEVVLMFPENFSSMPKMYLFNVSAVMQSGSPGFSSFSGLIDLHEGQRLFSIPNAVTGLDIHTKNFDRASATASQLQSVLSYPYVARAWTDMYKNFLSALKLEKIMMFLILGLIILVAAFNIISNLLLLSIQKSKEIGIMSAMGFSKTSISKIFFYEGLIIGSIGTILGIISGLAISLVLKYFDIFKLPKGVYNVDKLPVAIVPSDVFMIAASAFVITVIAGIYPAYQVSKLDPIEAIRYG
ncbi:ABC transporter permease [Endomicrobiia bacterium]|nr:ABC transporter permease [Endomicrobiia bacterium]